MTSGTKVGGRKAANPTGAVRTSTESNPGRHRQVSKRGLAVAGVGLIGIAGLARKLRRRKTEDA
ncbi:MAG TPA: hypothetical protein VH373_04265 [Jatrophihabitantaceae bacterium]|jgi:hypothetical protein